MKPHDQQHCFVNVRWLMIGACAEQKEFHAFLVLVKITKINGRKMWRTKADARIQRLVGWWWWLNDWFLRKYKTQKRNEKEDSVEYIYTYIYIYRTAHTFFIFILFQLQFSRMVCFGMAFQWCISLVVIWLYVRFSSSKCIFLLKLKKNLERIHFRANEIDGRALAT